MAEGDEVVPGATVIPTAEGYIVIPGMMEAGLARRLVEDWERALIEGKRVVLEESARFVHWTSEEGLRLRARRYLHQVGRLSHPHAALDPVGALGQVAADFAAALQMARCAAVAACVARLRTVLGEAADREAQAGFLEDDGGVREYGSVMKAHVLAELDRMEDGLSPSAAEMDAAGGGR